MADISGAARANTRAKVMAVAPDLIDLTDNLLFGKVWERKGLNKRDRSIITVATMIALYRTEQMRGYIDRALNNGVTEEEIGEIIMHQAFYAGWPCAMQAGIIAKEVFDARKE